MSPLKLFSGLLFSLEHTLKKPNGLWVSHTKIRQKHEASVYVPFIKKGRLGNNCDVEDQDNAVINKCNLVDILKYVDNKIVSIDITNCWLECPVCIIVIMKSSACVFESLIDNLINVASNMMMEKNALSILRINYFLNDDLFQISIS
ncbi:hypothetical protein BpHYR1_026924 [Brachionus plicatilis]|uniref:Uncharacterized protein n=1 Tax=Brachionus plicatilis TaxID=10195 RepID=A0A3M7QZQ1_BRAPC|nr:hypothetical protein BpHYR1_026924 [Brachionus plicatilis]